MQQQLQEAAQALGAIANAVPLGPQAVFQATESAAQSSQQSVQKALQQILQLQQQLQQQAASGAPSLMRQAEQLRSSRQPGSSVPGGFGRASPAAAPAAAPSAAVSPAAAQSQAAAPQPGSKEHLESATASQSLHPHEPAHPQAVAAAPTVLNEDENPTSVAEDEVDTIIARTNEADRYT